MIGLAGAHGTGKTTLAKCLAEKSDLAIPFAETRTSAVFEELGYSPKVDYDFATRLYIQEQILEFSNAMWNEQGKWFLTDRTPIDYLAYTLADVTRTNITDDEAARLKTYMKRCFEVANRHFGVIAVVQPGLPTGEREGKAPANDGYIEHINSLILGLVVDNKAGFNRYMLPRNRTDLEDRATLVINSMQRSEQRAINEIEQAGAYVGEEVVLH